MSPECQSESQAAQKAALRAAVRDVVDSISLARRCDASVALRQRLAVQRIWQNAASILLFAPMADEPDLWPMLELGLAAGRLIALPRFVGASGRYEAAAIQDPGRDVVAGRFGIREPSSLCDVVDLKRLDLVLVPGLAFDRHGRRLGRGRGYYDRLLAEVPGTSCGVAFDEQLVASVPVGPLDVPLNCILTPSHWIEI